MSKKPSYIDAHKALCSVLTKDIEVTATHKCFMEALFTFWNKRDFAPKFMISREDLMEVSKIRNKKTYYKVIKDLVTWEYITYVPSKNAAIVSTFGMGKKYLCDGSSGGISDGASNGLGGGSSSITFKKTIRPKTLDLIVEKIDLIDQCLEGWVEEHERLLAEGRALIPEVTFETFWDMMPKKEDKQDAIKAWKKLKPVEVDEIFRVLPQHIKIWKKKIEAGEKDFIPLPSTWLNKRRWENELTPVSEPTSLLSKFKNPTPITWEEMAGGKKAEA